MTGPRRIVAHTNMSLSPLTLQTTAYITDCARSIAPADASQSRNYSLHCRPVKRILPNVIVSPPNQARETRGALREAQEPWEWGVLPYVMSFASGARSTIASDIDTQL
jgi:hypothetical protein